ncbi:phosphogluconate dehydrogenase (NAD(+)-dependent, decarboxylating) [Anaeromyxobacter terrae]|uniref:phosphogluconate dehydrogenase (NAD(+)-dependent, decarboxylating) n=1 Tax=Anaeromyxobacter terrae TaxID=2925406 RepID=UPI001F5A061D|nr:decarboxylating 6-phosphogluconate dehydrogenase [Anaeromyxobacter sp. SG22]
MQLGMVGLGRMGSNMARRLLRAGHRVVAYDRDRAAGAALEREGAVAAASLDDLVRRLDPPRAAWVMLPAGAPTEETVSALGDRLARGDVIVDGGNSWFKDDARRARGLEAKGVRYVDAGTSGGVFGLERGYSLMIGGDAEAVRLLEPVFRSLAPGRAAVPATPGREGRTSTADDGYLHCGPAGAGHFVKMVHNGIEYALMQAFAEGFDILRGAAGDEVPEELRYQLDLAEVAEVWRRGSVVSSWLLDLAAAALARDPGLVGFTGRVPDSGEGRWTVQAAVEEAVPATVISAALYARFRSRQDHTFGEKLLSAMRRQFGGHAEAPASSPQGPPAASKGRP